LRGSKFAFATLKSPIAAAIANPSHLDVEKVSDEEITAAVRKASLPNFELNCKPLLTFKGRCPQLFFPSCSV
jgi:hypothetical protein